MTNPRDLTGAALITGGASGLGAATARRLHAEGMAVTIADLNAGAGAALVAELGERADFVELDVTDPDAVMAACASAAQADDAGLRITVACAGIGPPERLVGKRGTHRAESFRTVVEVNLLGTFHLLRAGAETMAANEPIDGERGLHVSTASIAAFEGQIGQVAYSASKGGVVGMTLPAARDLAQHAIRVCTIAPGLFDTPMMEGLPQTARDALGASVPFPARLGRPHEYADLVVAIARNAMLNGETIRLDGAIRLAPR
jgi:3-hydroxyacyl-CoA dehydrogenase/3-hydroxy-2-methylbutyryl-CoA dehydrogenase